MILKRQFGEEGCNTSPLSDHPGSPPAKLRKVVNHVLKELSLQEIAVKVSAALEPTIRRVVKEELRSLVVFFQSSPRPSLFLQSESSTPRGLQLHFTNKLPSTLFTNTTVRDLEHDFLQVKLVDARSKNLIQHSQFSSIKVEVLVLSADFVAEEQEDWTEAEFSRSIVHEREGKRPLLVGDLSFSLVNGIGSLNNVMFTDNSSWVRSRKFRLGIRAVQNVSSTTVIREAVSEAFVVLDHRGESYQKHDTPGLDDPVWRLKKISKMGASHKKLESLGIITVKDFLINYNMDPSYLRHVLGKGVANKAWETMVKHANECHLDNTLYSYSSSEGVQLVFNCVYRVVSAKFDGQVQSVDALDSRQKALVDDLKKRAFLNQNELVPIHNSSGSPPLASSTTSLNIPLSGTNLDLNHDGLSFVNQGALDFNISESASYPCTVEDGYLPGDDSTAQSDQPLQVFDFAPAALWTEDSTPFTPEPSSWYQNNATNPFEPDSQFGELALSYPQISTFDGFLTTSTAPTDTLIDILSHHLPNFGFSVSGNRKPKVRWCKLRAAVMWKIVRRNAAARRKAKLAFCCQCR